MTKTKINQLKAGSILSYIQMGLSVIINLVYTPVMINILGKSEYGLYNTVASTIAILSLLSLGFNSSYIRYYDLYKKENNEEGIRKLNGLFMIIFIIIGIVALLCGLFLSFHLKLVFDEGLTAAEYELGKILMLLLTCNLALSFPMSVFQSIISAHERYIVLKLLAMLKNVVGPLVTLPLLLMGYRSVAMVVVTIVVALVTDIVYLIYSKVSLKVRFRFSGFDKGLFRSLLIFTSFIAINLVVDQVNSNVGKFLLGRINGTEIVAVYSVGYTLYQLYMTFSTSVSGVFAPRIHKLANATSHDQALQRSQLTDLFIKVGRIQFLILALVASGVVFFGRVFIAYWVGSGFEDAYYVALLLILSSSIAMIQNLGIEIQRALNKHQFRSIVYLGMALLNIIITALLCPKLGAVGAAIGTSFALLIANGLIMNVFYHKRCNLDILAFWKNILRQALGLILPIGAGILLNHYFEYDTIYKLFFAIVIYTAVYSISVWCISMNRYEKDLILIPAKKLLSKLHFISKR